MIVTCIVIYIEDGGELSGRLWPMGPGRGKRSCGLRGIVRGGICRCLINMNVMGIAFWMFVAGFFVGASFLCAYCQRNCSGRKDCGGEARPQHSSKPQERS